MKVYFIDKYVIASFLLILIVTAVLGFGISRSAEVAATANHELPIYSVQTDKKEIALTFDTAWGDEDIDEILNALGNASCKATFFVTGEWLDKFPENAKKIAKAGHEVASHTDSHKHLTKLTDEEVLHEAKVCSEKIKAVTGCENKLIRAPYGEYDKNIIRLLREGGYTPIQWSLDSLDYKNLTPSEIDERILPKLKAGDIILFHTGTDNTAAYLPEILGKIKDMGYSFSTVGDMILKENYIIDSSGRQKRI